MVDWNQLRWLVNRLRVMPLAELPHRAQEQRHRWQDRTGRWKAPVMPLVSGHPPSILLQRNLTLSLSQQNQLTADVDVLLSQQFTMMGTEWSSRSAWGEDPVSGTPWPAASPAHSVSLWGESRDVRVAWELLRLQHLHVLALGAVALGREDAREAALADLQDWLSWDTPFCGISYASGIECACRVMSLLTLSGLLDPLPADLHAQIWQSLHHHASWLRRYPSRYSSANNHRIAELGALYVLALVAPELGGDSVSTLEAELCAVGDAQFHADGVGTEQSLTYQAFTMEWLALGLWCARHHGRHLPVGGMLLRGATFLYNMLDGKGNAPLIGDNDEGVVLRVGLAPEPLPANICGLIAGLLNAPELCPETWAVDVRSKLMGLTVSPKAVSRRSRCFPDGGYTVLRDKSVQVVLDHGPLGFPSTGGHGHADALAIWVHKDGKPVIVDSGTYRYNGDVAWRTWARSTRSHNTVEVGESDQSVMAGSFNWQYRAQASLLDFGERSVTATHDGYAARFGVVHQRTVTLGDDGFVIADHLLGEGGQVVRVTLNLAPDLRATVVDGGWVIQRGEDEVARVDLRGVVLAGAVLRCGAHPKPGTHSPRYNVATPVDCLQWHGAVVLPTSWEIHWTWKESS